MTSGYISIATINKKDSPQRTPLLVLCNLCNLCGSVVLVAAVFFFETLYFVIHTKQRKAILYSFGSYFKKIPQEIEYITYCPFLKEIY